MAANITHRAFCTQINPTLNTCTVLHFIKSQKSKTELSQLFEHQELLSYKSFSY